MMAKRSDPRCAAAEQEDRYVGHNTLHFAGPVSDSERLHTPIVVSLIRDAEIYIDAFVHHYRSLGCRRIIMLDNGSSDRTVEKVRAYPEVTLLHCSLPFDLYKRAMRRYLIRSYCKGAWCLCVDVDEFFDYPESRCVGLDHFIAYLERYRFSAVVAQMLDMFPERLVRMPDSEDLLFRQCHRLFDVAHIEPRPYLVPGNHVADPRVQMYYGGIRAAVFGFKPWLTKHPLFYCNEEVLPFLEDSHRVEQARVADVTSVLYHYKFAGDFHCRVERAVREENYYHASHEYKCYSAVLQMRPSVELRQPTSQVLDDPEILLNNGFLVASDAYKRFTSHLYRT